MPPSCVGVIAKSGLVALWLCGLIALRFFASACATLQNRNLDRHTGLLFHESCLSIRDNKRLLKESVVPSVALWCPLTVVASMYVTSLAVSRSQITYFFVAIPTGGKL